MEEIIPGIWFWTATHPELGIEVSSYYLADAHAVLDPVVPQDGLDAFEDHQVDQVILTNRLHGRHTEQFVQAFGARVRSPRPGMHQFEGRSYAVEPFDFGEEIAPGVTALEMGAICPDDGVLHLSAGDGALHFADGLLIRHDELHLMPDNLMDDPETVKAKSFERLRALEDLHFDAILFAHSDPILTGARQRLLNFLS